jgi:hypothetical protein
VVQTNIRAIIAALIPGGVMKYLRAMIGVPSREEIGNIQFGSRLKNVKMQNRPG